MGPKFHYFEHEIGLHNIIETWLVSTHALGCITCGFIQPFFSVKYGLPILFMQWIVFLMNPFVSYSAKKFGEILSRWCICNVLCCGDACNSALHTTIFGDLQNLWKCTFLTEWTQKWQAFHNGIPQPDYEVHCRRGPHVNFDHLGFFKMRLNLGTWTFLYFTPIEMQPAQPRA